MPNSQHKFSDDLNKLKEYDDLTLQKLLETLNEKGIFLASLFLAVPFLQPFPMFGLSTILGGVIFFNGITIAILGKPWIPQFLGKKHIPRDWVIMLDKAMVKIFFYIEKFVKPRGRLFVRFKAVHRINGFMIAIAAFLLALPLPIPSTNITPAFAIALVTIGAIEEDAYTTIIGYVVTLLNILFFALIPILFFEAMMKIDWFAKTFMYLKNLF